MSAEATGWVYRHSPYKGAAFAVHLAIADSVNDQNADEFWMRQTVLARKARTTRGTVNAAIAKMVDDDLLELVREGSGGANRYRFLMPDDTATVYNPRAWTDGVSAPTTPPEGVRSDDTGCAPGRQGVSAGTTGGARSPDTEPKENPTNPSGAQPLALVLADDAPAADPFDVFWDLYPRDRRTGKADARRAWDRAVKRATPDVIIDGLRRYIDETADRKPHERRFIKTPAPWLNDDRWLDEPGANRRGDRPTPGRVVGDHGTTGRVAPEDL